MYFEKCFACCYPYIWLVLNIMHYWYVESENMKQEKKEGERDE